MVITEASSAIIAPVTAEDPAENANISFQSSFTKIIDTLDIVSFET